MVQKKQGGLAGQENFFLAGSKEDKTYHKRWKILPVVMLGGFMGTLDGSIVNVALPMMAEELQVGLNSIQWVVTSYLITISALIVIFGKVADRQGKSKVFLQGFLIFGLGSLLCGFSRSLGFLVFSRVIQAIGAAMYMSSNQGIAAEIFPPHERGRALGLLGTAVAVGTLLGPTIGGFIVEWHSWQMIFFINIPIAVLGLFFGLRLLPKKEPAISEKKFDVLGSMLFIGTVVLLFWAILSSEAVGWTDPWVLGAFALSLLCGIAFYKTEKKAANPMLELGIFHNSLLDVSLLCGYISFLSMMSLNIIHPFYLQYLLGLSPAQAGLLMMVSPLCITVVAPVSGYLSDKIGSEALTFLGLALIALGLGSMAFLGQQATSLDIVLRSALAGIGNGMFQSPNNAIIMSSVDKNKLGIAGSINGLVRNMGMVSGISFSVVLLYNRMSSQLGFRVTSFAAGQNQAFLYGMKMVYLAAASICLLGTLITALRMQRSKTLKA